MAHTGVDVCNLAIGKVGGEPIEAIGEDSPLGDFCQLNYPNKRDYLLSLYDWRFANTFAQLAQVSPTPAGTPLRHLYKPPSDLVGEIHAFRDAAGVHGRKIRCLVSAVGVSSDHGQVFAEYSARMAEAAWPAWFVEFVATAFAADLAQRRPNAALAATLYAEAFGPPEDRGEGGKYQAARQADGRNAPERQLFYDEPGPLIEARLGGSFFGFGLRPIVVDTSNG